MRLLRLAAATGAVVVAAAAVFVFGPSALGGGAEYVTTRGDSMEPQFHTGDLALVRPAEHYTVGDVVAYRSLTLDTVVMHRIVAVESGRYTFQGDNNSWLDPDRPTRADFVGALALRIPQGGIWLQRATSPAALGLFTFALLASGGAAAGAGRQRRRHPMSQHATRRPKPPHTLTALSPPMRTVALATAVVAVAGIVLAAVAWTQPTAGLAAASDDEQSMTFAYTADVGTSAAYDQTTIEAPQPVFRKLTDVVDVRYAYRGAPGKVAVAAELSAPTGWNSTVDLTEAAAFTGDSYQDTVRLDLGALESRAQKAAAATGLPASQITVAIIPRVTTRAGTSFAPALRFNLDPLVFALADESKSLTVTDASAQNTTPATETIGLLGQDIGARSARTVSAVLVLFALLATAGIVLLARRSAPISQAEAIRRRYAASIVDVQPISTPTGRAVVDVAGFKTLARLAERYGLLVLHWSRSGVDTFIVHDDSATYRLRIGTDSSAALPDQDRGHELRGYTNVATRIGSTQPVIHAKTPTEPFRERPGS